jgi:hypothetical protein
MRGMSTGRECKSECACVWPPDEDLMLVYNEKPLKVVLIRYYKYSICRDRVVSLDPVQSRLYRVDMVRNRSGYCPFQPGHLIVLDSFS